MNMVGSGRWEQLSPSGAGPTAREGHTATNIRHCIYIFGGSAPVGKTDKKCCYYNDLHCLNTGALPCRPVGETLSVHHSPQLDRRRTRVRFRDAGLFCYDDVSRQARVMTILGVSRVELHDG